MTRKTKTLSLAMLFAITTLPAYAASPSPQPAATPAQQPVAAAILLESILAPGGVPAPVDLSLTNPYIGYCSATCAQCFSSAPTPCPPDPDTGLRQSCTRTRVC